MSVVNVDEAVKKALDKIKNYMQKKEQKYIRYNDVVVFLLHHSKSKEITELKSCVKIIDRQMREIDKDNANLHQELRDYQEYFRLLHKLLKWRNKK